MPVEERRALARDLDHLKRYPDDPRNERDSKTGRQALDKKKKAALTRKQMEKAKEAMSKGDPEKALFYVEMASFIDPQSRQFDETRQQATKALRDLDDARKITLAARPEARSSAEQQTDVKRLLEALSLRDSNHLQRVAIDIEKKYQGKAVGRCRSRRRIGRAGDERLARSGQKSSRTDGPVRRRTPKPKNAPRLYCKVRNTICSRRSMKRAPIDNCNR